MTPHFDVNLVYARDTGRGERLVGKYLVHDGEIHVVSDYTGILEGLDGQRIDRVTGRLRQLHHASYYRVETRNPSSADVKQAEESGAWEDEVFSSAEGTANPEETPRGPEVHGFSFQRPGQAPMDVQVSHDGSRVTSGGAALSPEQVRDLLDAVRRGEGSLMRTSDPVQKAIKEALLPWSPLMKNLNDSFEQLRALVAKGHLEQHHYDSLRRELYQDEMIPGIGNKRAHRDFIASGPDGVHVVLDGDGLKAVNEHFGHVEGDRAITALGTALRSAVDKTVGPEQAKVHRTGGDEFHFFVPTRDHAHRVLRQLHTELQAIPPVRGVHSLGFSAGIGMSHDHADMAQKQAKEQKNDELTSRGFDPSNRRQLVVMNTPLRVHDGLAPVAPAGERPEPTAFASAAMRNMEQAQAALKKP